MLYIVVLPPLPPPLILWPHRLCPTERKRRTNIPARSPCNLLQAYATTQVIRKVSNTCLSCNIAVGQMLSGACILIIPQSLPVLSIASLFIVHNSEGYFNQIYSLHYNWACVFSLLEQVGVSGSKRKSLGFGMMNDELSSCLKCSCIQCIYCHRVFKNARAIGQHHGWCMMKKRPKRRCLPRSRAKTKCRCPCGRIL